MIRSLSVCALLSAGPAMAQWLSDPSATPPYLSTPGDVTSGGVVSGEEGRFQFLGNPDGGVVEAPAGLGVNQGSNVCLNAACTTRVYHSVGGQLALQGAVGGVAIVDGAYTQGVFEANSLQPNSVELVGGATAVTVRAASGTGATPDATLILQAGGPDGVVQVANSAGLRTAAAGSTDGGLMLITGQGTKYTSTTLPACDGTTEGAEVQADIGGGLGARRHLCSSGYWYVFPFGSTFNTFAQGGVLGVPAGGLIDAFTPVGGYGGLVSVVSFTVQAPGTCGGACTPPQNMLVTVRQGGSPLCTLAFSCTAAAGHYSTTCGTAPYAASPIVEIVVDPTTQCDKRAQGTVAIGYVTAKTP